MKQKLLVIILFIGSIFTAKAADFYWVGGTGNWTDTLSWSTVSGGAPDVSVVPSLVDNAIFDAGSGLTPTDTVYLDTLTIINNWDFSVVGNIFTLTSTVADLTLHGSLLSSPSGINWDWPNGEIQFSDTGAEGITSNTAVWGIDIRVNGPDVTLVDNLNMGSKDIYVDLGSFISGGMEVSFWNFYSNLPALRLIDISNSVLNFSGIDWIIDPTTLTFTSSGSDLNVLNTSSGVAGFYGGGQVYDSVRVTGVDVTFYDDNSFQLLTSSQNFYLNTGSLQTVDSMSVNGICGAPITIATSGGVTSASFTKSGYPVYYATNLIIDNIDANAPATYNLQLSDTINGSDNWTMVGATYYWVGNGGNWSDAAHWSFSSGGPTAVCTPGIPDTVIFDALSFSAAGQVVLIDSLAEFSKMDWTTVGFPSTLDLDTNIISYGDITFYPDLYVTRDSLQHLIQFVDQAEFDPSSSYVDCNIGLFMSVGSDSVSLFDNLQMSDSSSILLFSGRFYTQGNNISTGNIFSVNDPSTNLDERLLDIQNSTIDLLVSFNSVGDTSLVFNANGSQVNIGDNVSYQNGVETEGLVFNNVKLHFTPLTRTTGHRIIQKVYGNNSFNKLEVTPGSHVFFQMTHTQTILDSLIMKGTCLDSIFISSTDTIGFTNANINVLAGSDAVIHCTDISGMNNSGLVITALFSNNTINNNNWTFSALQSINADFTLDGPFCFGDTTLLTNTTTLYPGFSGYSSQWYFNDNSTGYYLNPPTDSTWINWESDTTQHEFLVSGDLNVQLIVTNENGCKDTSIQVVHINNPVMSLITTEADNQICDGDVVTFEANGLAPNMEFEFFFNGVSQNTPSANDTLYTSNSLNTGDIVGVMGYENGCPIDSMITMSFNVNPLPSITFSSNLGPIICAEDSVAFSAIPVNITDTSHYTYQFLLNGTSVAFTPVGFYWTETLADNDIMSVIVKDSMQCRDTLALSFTVNPLPTTTLSESTGGNVICTGQNVVFTASGANTYEFFVNGVSQGPAGTNVWSTTTLTTGDTVSVVGYSVDNCPKQAPEIYYYTVNPLPSVSMAISDADTSICSGTNVTFTASGASLYELFLNGVSQGAPGAISIFNIPTLVDGDQVYIEGSFSGCANQSGTATFEVLTSPTTTLVSSDADQTICSQETVTFTASGANNYQFFVNGVSQGAPSPTNTFVTNSLLNGQTISVTGESNTCLLSQGITFTVLAIPTVNLFSNDPDNTICEGESVTFTAANAATYEMFINGTSQGAPQASPTFIPTLSVGTNTVYVIGTGANGCSDTSLAVIDITVNPLPTITLSSSDVDNIICEGESVTFSGTGSDMYQFFLNGISQGSLSATSTYTNSNLPNGATIYIYGSTLGCTNTSNTIVTTVNPIPSINLSSTDVDNVFCEGDIVDFTATGATNYEFFVDGVSQGPSSPINTINSTGFTSGSYLINVIGESNGCVDNTNLSVIVQTLPTAAISSSDLDNIICSGVPVTYTGTGGSLFEFFVNGVSQGSFSPVNTFSTSSLVNGDVVSVMVTSPQGCSDPESMLAITVNSTPTVVLTSSDIDQTICLNENVVFTGNGSTLYEFFVNGVSQGPLSPVNTFSTNTLANGDGISLNGSSNGCTGNASALNFTVYNPPLVTLTNNSDTLLCTSELTDLTAAGANNYQFLVNGNPVGGSTTNPNFNGALNNGDIVTVIGETNGCPSTAANSFSFTVYSYPSLASIASPGTTICLNDLVSFNASGALTYEYAVNGVVVQNGITSNYSTSSLVNGDVVSVTGYNGDCASNPTNYTFTVNTMLLNLVASPSNLICEGENVTFTASGGTQYEFFVNGVSQGAMSPTNTFSSATLVDGDEVTFTAFNSATGCTQAYSDYTIMNVIDEPTISSNTSLQFCEGDSVVLLSNAPYGNQWFLNGSPIVGATDTSYTVYDSGTYALEVTGGGDGDVWSFGLNASGNLGTGDNLNYADPVIASTTETFTALSSGYQFVLAITTSGGVFAWGNNEFGQLGDGTYADKNIPQTVPTLSNIKAIATTETSSMAVTNSGALYVWGNNNEGQLATGNTSVINFPFLNVNINNIDSIAGGRNHFVFLKSDGTVWTVGNNDYGQLGQGNLNGSMNPLQVPLLSNIVSVGAGEYHSFAINALGDLFVWGNNGSGQLGLNDLTNRLSPTPSPLKNIINAQGGANHSVLLSSDKKVYTCGGNVYGQLGTNNYTNSLVPVLANVSGAVMISAGEYSTLVRRADNMVYGFGNNAEDQLSSPNGNSIATPELISDVEGVTFIEASQSSSHLIYGDGTTCVSQSVTTNLLTAPQATISANGDTLSTVFASSYQWYFNGNPIPGGTSQTLVASNSGNYYVEVTYANGCTSTSPSLYHSMTAINKLALGDVKVYPNPAGSQINVSIDGSNSEDLELEIHDQTGRLISEQNFGLTSFVSIDINSLNPGVYYITLRSGQLSGTVKFIKVASN